MLPDPDGLYVVNEAGAESEDRQVRRHFVDWVFGILALQWVFTGLSIIFSRRIFKEKAYGQLLTQVADNAYEPLIMPFILIPFIVILASKRARRGCCGIFCLILLSCLLSSAMCILALPYLDSTVLMAACVTAVITLTITIASACIKAFDVTKYYAAMIVVTFFGILCYLLLHWLDYVLPESILAQVIFGSIGSLISSMLLLYLIQTILGGRKIVLRPDERIYAQARLYVNTVFIYQFLLALEW